MSMSCNKRQRYTHAKLQETLSRCACGHMVVSYSGIATQHFVPRNQYGTTMLCSACVSAITWEHRRGAVCQRVTPCGSCVCARQHTTSHMGARGWTWRVRSDLSDTGVTGDVSGWAALKAATSMCAPPPHAPAPHRSRPLRRAPRRSSGRWVAARCVTSTAQARAKGPSIHWWPPHRDAARLTLNLITSGIGCKHM